MSTEADSGPAIFISPHEQQTGQTQTGQGDGGRFGDRSDEDAEVVDPPICRTGRRAARAGRAINPERDRAIETEVHGKPRKIFGRPNAGIGCCHRTQKSVVADKRICARVEREQLRTGAGAASAQRNVGNGERTRDIARQIKGQKGRGRGIERAGKDRGSGIECATGRQPGGRGVTARGGGGGDQRGGTIVGAGRYARSSQPGNAGRIRIGGSGSKIPEQ